MEFLLLVAWLCLLTAIGAIPCITGSILYDRVPRVQAYCTIGPRERRAAGAVVFIDSMAPQGKQEILTVWFPIGLPVSAEIVQWTGTVERLCWPTLVGRRYPNRWRWTRTYREVVTHGVAA